MEIKSNFYSNLKLIILVNLYFAKASNIRCRLYYFHLNSIFLNSLNKSEAINLIIIQQKELQFNFIIILKFLNF